MEKNRRDLKWAKVAVLFASAVWCAWDALDGMHFHTVQRDMGRKLEGRVSQALSEGDQIALRICVQQNDSVRRAFVVELLAALSLAGFALRFARAKANDAEHGS